MTLVQIQVIISLVYSSKKNSEFGIKLEQDKFIRSHVLVYVNPDN
jgi:hypothetical protein